MRHTFVALQPLGVVKLHDREGHTLGRADWRGRADWSTEHAALAGAMERAGAALPKLGIEWTNRVELAEKLRLMDHALDETPAPSTPTCAEGSGDEADDSSQAAVKPQKGSRKK